MQLRILAVGAIVFAATLPAVADPPAPPQGDGEQRELNDRKIESAGIRKLTGKHLILVTDVPSSPEIDRLPAVFDAAVPLWAEYFGVDLKKTERWQARGYLMGERRRFESLGLLPPGQRLPHGQVRRQPAIVWNILRLHQRLHVAQQAPVAEEQQRTRFPGFLRGK